MFTDIVGYSALAQQDEARAMRVLADQAAIIRACASTHAGREIKTMGDGFLVEFDSALAATQCAINIQKVITERNQRPGANRVEIRIGIHVGDVIHEGSDLLGDAVNIASRLEPLAEPGGICISSPVFEQVHNQIEWSCTKLEETKLKNIDYHGGLYRIDAPKFGPESVRISPLVGREDSVQLIHGILDRATHGSGSIVMLSGEAGVGKSRLAEEVKGYAALKGVRTLSGSCLESESGAPYYPWIQLFQAYVAQASPQALHRACGLFADEIAKLVPEIAEKIPVQSTPSGGPSERERVRLFRGLTQFLVNIARDSPVLVELSDLNWADSGSLELLEQVARGIRSQPLMVLGTYRDVEVEENSALARVLFELSRERLIHTLHLNRLDKVGVARMIETTFDRESTPEFVDLVYERTGGNPFFVEEVFRSLVEEGTIFRTPSGRWERKPIAEIEIPSSVRKVIRRRLDRLDEECQGALRIASVIGNEFGFEVLQKVSGVEESHLIDLLEKILKARILKERSLPAGRTSYVFTDLQIRGALYAEMSAIRHRRYHERVAQELEAIHPRRIEEVASELAHHYMLGNDPDKALRYSILAAERAARLYAHREAVKQYRTALELLEENPDDARKAGVLEQLGTESDRLGHPEEALKAWETAIGLYQSSGNRLRAGDLHRRVGLLHLLYFRTREKTLESLLTARTILENEPESVELANVYSGLAYMYWLESQGQPARELAMKALEVAERTAAHEARAGAYEILGFLSPPNQKSQVMENLRRELEISKQQNLQNWIIQAHRSIGSVWQMGGDCQEGLRWFEAGADLARRQGNLPWEMTIRGDYMAYCLVYAGELDKAEELAEASFEFYSRFFPRPEPLNLCARGHVALIRGELSRAEQYLSDALLLSRHPILWTARSGCHVGLGRLYLERGETARAVEYLESILDSARGLGTPAMWGMIHAQTLSLLIEARMREPGNEVSEALLPPLSEALSELSRQMGEDGIRAYELRAQALLSVHGDAGVAPAGALEESVRLWRKVRWPYELAKTLFVLGSFYQRQGEREKASESFNEAFEIFTRLGARPDAERVHACREQLSSVQSSDSTKVER